MVTVKKKKKKVTEKKCELVARYKSLFYRAIQLPNSIEALLKPGNVDGQVVFSSLFKNGFHCQFYISGLTEPTCDCQQPDVLKKQLSVVGSRSASHEKMAIFVKDT